MIEITPKAQAIYRQLLADRPNGTCIRIFVDNPGTPEAQCGMSYCPSHMYDMADIVYPMEGFDLVIDPVSDPYLEDAVVDAKAEMELTMKSPSVSKDFLSKELPLIDRIKFVVSTQVNPGIATHGGAVEVVSFSEETREVSVKFKGGCVGCASVGVTINESLQAKINSMFPGEGIKVTDVTQHEVTGDTYKG